jgi:hypothetical protein
MAHGQHVAHDTSIRISHFVGGGANAAGNRRMVARRAGWPLARTQSQSRKAQGKYKY